MRNKHTAKSVGLAPAFPFRDLTEAQYYDGADIKPGMTYAQWLYGQNVAGFSSVGGSPKDLATAASWSTMEQLKEVAKEIEINDRYHNGKKETNARAVGEVSGGD